MPLEPAIFALLLASGANFVVLAAMAPLAVAVLRHWDLASGAERQLNLERRTYLVSALLSLVMTAQLLALLLFVFNADRMSTLFVGAMCAVGALRVNEYGFPALFAQIAMFFLAAAWLVLHRVDTRAPDYPLVRVEYAFLLGLTPVAAAVFGLELRYFLGLRADTVTSCCSRLFSGEASGLSGDLAALPALPAAFSFFAALLAAIAAACHTMLRKRGAYLLAISSLVACAAALAGIVSFLSLYIYEHPHHHCPFCILKAEYAYQGYWLYVPLFVATAAGLSAGAVAPCARWTSLRDIVPLAVGRLAGVAAAGFATFVLVSALMIWKSHLILTGS